MLCALTVAALVGCAHVHPGALACGDKQMALGQTIMKLKVTKAPSDQVSLTFTPKSYKAGQPVTVTATGWNKGAYIALGVSGPGAKALGKASNGTFSGFDNTTVSAACASQVYHTTLTAPAVPPVSFKGVWTPPADAKGDATFTLLWSEGPFAAKKYVYLLKDVLKDGTMNEPVIL